MLYIFFLTPVLHMLLEEIVIKGKLEDIYIYIYILLELLNHYYISPISTSNVGILKLCGQRAETSASSPHGSDRGVAALNVSQAGAKARSPAP